MSDAHLAHRRVQDLVLARLGIDGTEYMRRCTWCGEELPVVDVGRPALFCTDECSCAYHTMIMLERSEGST